MDKVRVEFEEQEPRQFLAGVFPANVIGLENRDPFDNGGYPQAISFRLRDCAEITGKTPEGEEQPASSMSGFEISRTLVLNTQPKPGEDKINNRQFIGISRALGVEPIEEDGKSFLELLKFEDIAGIGVWLTLVWRRPRVRDEASGEWKDDETRWRLAIAKIEKSEEVENLTLEELFDEDKGSKVGF